MVGMDKGQRPVLYVCPGDVETPHGVARRKRQVSISVGPVSSSKRSFCDGTYL